MRTLPAVLADPAGLTERLNNDPEFRIGARYWDCRLRLDLGSRSVGVVITGGSVAEVDLGPQGTWDVVITGPEEGWAKLFSPVPPPFYTDVFPAMKYHGFSITGDLASLVAYHPAMRRMMDTIRESARSTRDTRTSPGATSTSTSTVTSTASITKRRAPVSRSSASTRPAPTGASTATSSKTRRSRAASDSSPTTCPTTVDRCRLRVSSGGRRNTDSRCSSR